jgi:hypothetical protein
VDGARWVADNILTRDTDMRVLVVWIPMVEGDSREAATQSAKIFNNPRVSQFWDGDKAAGIWMYDNVVKNLPRLKDKGVFRRRIAWDVFFLYSREATLTDEPVTAGATVMGEKDLLLDALPAKLPHSRPTPNVPPD